MEKYLQEHRRAFGEMEVIDFVDIDKIEAVRAHTSSNTTLPINWTWEYGSDVAELRRLYEKGKVNQWNAQTDLDWGIPVTKDDWVLAPEESLMAQLCAQLGMDEATQKAAAFDELAYLLSQLLHGEQAALQLCGQLTNVCESLDQKSYAASQVIDEARHIEVFAKFLSEKMGTLYPISPAIKPLLDELLAADTVQKKTLGMQCLFEGTAVGIMDTLHRESRNGLLTTMLRRVEQDESRHAAFGVLCMRRVVEEAEPEEMESMEDWSYQLLETVQSSIGMTLLRELGPKYGINPEDIAEVVFSDPGYADFTSKIYMHTVAPNLKRLGLITDRTAHLWRESGLIVDRAAA